MSCFKWTGLVALVLMAASFCSAQQKFSQRPGEWEVTTSAPGSNLAPMTALFCLNDQMWQKALTQNPLCSVEQFTMTSTGARYNLVCNMRTHRMTGSVEMTFDGREHMIANGSIDMTMNGKTTHSTSLTDYRWKGAACSPNDMNLRPKRTQQ